MHQVLQTAQVDLAFLARLVIAASLGAVLGWEREQSGKPAGLRTLTTVALTSALFIVLAEAEIAQFANRAGLLRMDPLGVIQAVAVGVGFLGAGEIFVADSSSRRIQGLTTAASIWATAAVGVAAGIQHYVLALGATVILWVTLRVVRRLGLGRG